MENEIKKIIVFTGAGFCVPMNLPITSGFLKAINQGSVEIRDILKFHLQERYDDIECIMSTLDDFINLTSFYESAFMKAFPNLQQQHTKMNSLKEASEPPRVSRRPF